MGDAAIMVAGVAARWRVLADTARDNRVQELKRAAALQLLGDHGRAQELREIAESPDLPANTRALSHLHIHKIAPDTNR
jgi:hypothetical protein